MLALWAISPQWAEEDVFVSSFSWKAMAQELLSGLHNANAKLRMLEREGPERKPWPRGLKALFMSFESVILASESVKFVS